jgi:hypothetical protein
MNVSIYLASLKPKLECDKKTVKTIKINFIAISFSCYTLTNMALTAHFCTFIVNAKNEAKEGLRFMINSCNGIFNCFN